MEKVLLERWRRSVYWLWSRTDGDGDGGCISAIARLGERLSGTVQNLNSTARMAGRLGPWVNAAGQDSRRAPWEHSFAHVRGGERHSGDKTVVSRAAAPSKQLMSLIMREICNQKIKFLSGPRAGVLTFLRFEIFQRHLTCLQHRSESGPSSMRASSIFPDGNFYSHDVHSWHQVIRGIKYAASFKPAHGPASTAATKRS